MDISFGLCPSTSLTCQFSSACRNTSIGSIEVPGQDAPPMEIVQGVFARHWSSLFAIFHTHTPFSGPRPEGRSGRGSPTEVFFFFFPNSGPRLVRSRRASACVGLSTPNHTLLTVTSAPHTYVFMQSCSAQPLRRRTLAPRSPCFIARFEAQCDTSSKYHNPRLWSLLILDLVVLPASRSFLELVVSWYVVVERKRTESWICWKATIMTSRDLSFYAHFRPYFNAAPPVK